VRNDGDRAGDEVVEVYLDAPDVSAAPRHALVGFRRIHLEAGERRRVEFELAPRQLANVDAQGHRAVEPGHYRLFIGGNQPEAGGGVSASFVIGGRAELPP
jgi:beta-glucosidase